MVPLRSALAYSINRVSAYLIKQFGVQPVLKMVRRMGIKSPIDAVPSICLGTADISVYEMVGAMSTFVNKGVYIEPTWITRIEDKNGKLTNKPVDAFNHGIDACRYAIYNTMSRPNYGKYSIR
jgi:penicillin-binding protein 1A